MKVRMTVALTGSVDGTPYPPVGGELDTTDEYGAELCQRGLAVPVVSEPPVERAVGPQAEKRTARKRTAK
jgi:hypothetical protein